MRVEELVIDGFKSYSVRTVITPWDSQFNAITGLNGSGKSNILDAICFVLGITSTSSLRAFNMQDLIYKKGQAGVTKASVTITFDNSDKENSPVNRKNDAKISITRKIQVENQNSTSSKYLINGRKATQKEVANMLQSVQLNINNPNFLIMQGKITQMLNMKPKQILNLIEEAAGTKSYESQRESSIKIINKKQNKLNTIRSTLKEEVEPKLAELQRQTEIVFEFKDKSSERDTYLQILAALNYSKGKEILAQIQPEFERSKMKLNELNSSIENFENQIVELEKQINEIKSKSQNNNSESNKLLKDLENTEKALINEITRMKTSRDLNISQIDDYKLKIEQNKVKINEINQSLLNNNENFENMQKEFKKEEENLANFKRSLNKKEDLVSTLSTGISSKGTDSGYNAQLRDANKKLTETKTIIEQKKLQINDLKNSLDTNLKKVHETEILKIKTTINEKEKNIELLKDQLRKMGFDQPEYDSLRNEEKHLLQELNQKNRQLQDFIGHDSRFDFHYEKPTSDFDPSSVKGLCGELFELPENNNRASTALEVCAGFKLFNVVVDTEKTGSLLLDKGNLRKRVTIIPLNKINSKVLNNNILQEAKKISPNKVELALNLVNYDGTVEKAIEYIFGNKLICDDPETAKKVTFNDKIRTSSITLDGDNYDPEGRLSGGSRRNNSSTIYKFAKYRVLREQIHNIESSLHEISNKLNRMNSTVEKNRGIQQQLTKEEFYLNSLQAKLSNSDSIKYIERFEGNSKLIKELQESVETDLYSLKTTQNEIAQINKDMQEFNSNGSAKLNEIRKEIKQMKAELHSKENKLNKRRLTLNSESVQKEDLLNDLETLSNNNSNMTEEIKKLEILIGEQEEAINDNQLKLDELSQNISDEKKIIASTVVELNALSEHLSNTKDRLDDYKSQKDSMLANANQLKHMKKQAESNINNAIQEFEWMENDARRNEILTKNPNVDNKICESKIEECDKRITQLREKGADENIIQQSTTLIQLKEDLVKKITKIEKDKEKIQSTVAKLDEHLKTKLEDTFQKVSADFGETFALLLPDAYAKLEKTDKNGDITKGLEVKVRLGSIWKESLVELSGGQRSLVALALIMSLLQYNPAPLYILDEVDAALDLSHTQSIGHLIKTKFKGAQFIVVSLKEGMFTNANQLFKVRFQDGTSVVTPTNRRI